MRSSKTNSTISGAPSKTVSADNSRAHVLLATWLGEMFDGMDASIFVLVLFPAMSELLKTTSHSTAGVYGSIVLATFMVGWAAGAILFGILSDYIGRTRTMILSILLYALCTGLCALSHSWIELAVYRFLVGCGIGGEISAGAVLLSECWRGNSRLHAAGIVNSSFGSGYLIAALLNLWLGHFGWRWLFLAGVIPALLTVYLRCKLKEPAQFELVREYKKRLKCKTKEKLSPQESELLRFTFGQIFARGTRGKTAVVAALASTTIVGYWAVLAWLPPWINQLTGTSAVAERSAAAIAMNIGAIIFSLLSGSIVLWLGRRNAFRFAFLGALVCCAGMFLTVKAFGPLLLVWAFAVGCFVPVPFAFLFVYVPELFAARIRGTAFGFSVQFGRLAAAVAALCGGQLIAFFGGSYAYAGACLAGFYLVGIVVSFFMPHTNGEVEAALEVPLPEHDKPAGELLTA